MVAMVMGVMSCIPLEDIENPIVSPNIEDFPLQTTYFYSDTIKIKAIYTDNSLLDTIGVQIRKQNLLPNEDPWNYFFVADISGRRYDALFEILVPNYKALGNYEIILFAKDGEGNFSSEVNNFTLEGDVRVPVISNLEIGLPKLNDQYVACRSTLIPVVSGTATDNIDIKRIEVSIDGVVSSKAVSGSFINIASILAEFANNLKIPPQAANGSIVNFTISVVDGSGNKASKNFEILIDCDDQAPTLEFVSSEPIIDDLRQVSVIQGTDFEILEIIAQDNSFLDSAFVYFYPSIEEPILIDSVALNTANPVNLADVMDLVFSIPVNDPVGKKYDIVLVVTDTTGRSADYKIQLTVLEDKAPSIFVGPTYIRNITTKFSEDVNAPLIIKVGDFITFDGRVEEDNEISNFVIKWGDKVVVDTSNLSTKVLNLSDFNDETSCIVTRDTPLDTKIVLYISVTDNRRRKVEKNYYFIVGQ
ncbi:MAG: hypothetical protein OHK0038_16410 [Flammeovirgaceae bacterium]